MQAPARCSNHRCVYIDQCGSVVVDLLFDVLPSSCVGSVFVFVLLCITFMPFLVLLSSVRERVSWLLCFYCLTDVLLL